MVRYIRSIGLALLFSAFVGSLGQTEGRALNYLMSLEGGCSKLLVNGEKLKCKNALIHTEYADGRIGFYFLEDVVNGQILTFSGSGLEQKALSENVRIQPVDGVIQSDGFLNVFGECYFENPFIGPANIKCEAVDATGMQFQGHFLTDGLAPDIKDFTKNSNLDEVQRQTEFETSKGPLAYRCSDADSEGRSALHFLAKQKDTKPLMAFLEQDNSNINCVDDYGETPLHFAAALGSLHSIQILLENGADPRLQNNIGQGALALAQKNPALMEAAILNELANKFNKYSPNAAKVENTLSMGSVGNAGSNNVEVVNEVTELKFSYLKTIPMGPLPNDFDKGWCDRSIIEPNTISGKNILKKGWGILSEQSLGPFEFVSFAGEFKDGLSGSCIISQGNVAIFKAGELVGVIYTSLKDDELIGKLWIAEGGVVQLLNPLFQSWADIKILKDKIQIEYKASVQSFCNGAVIVPNVVGEPIREARQSLIEFAWEPTIQTEEVVLSFVEEMRQSRIVETIDCAGTGFGYCSFEYENANASLYVTTSEQTVPVGYDDVVLYYGVSCK